MACIIIAPVGIAMHPGAAGCIGCIIAGLGERRPAGTAAARDVPASASLVAPRVPPGRQQLSLHLMHPGPETDVRAPASSPGSHAARRRADALRTWPPHVAVADRPTLLTWTCDMAGQIRTRTPTWGNSLQAPRSG